MRRVFRFAVFAFHAAACLSLAADLRITEVVATPAAGADQVTLEVVFDRSVPAGQLAVVLNPASWSVFRSVAGRDAADSFAPASVSLQSSEIVVLTAPATTEPVRFYTVALRAYNVPTGQTRDLSAPSQPSPGPPPPSADWLVFAESRKDATIYLSGAVLASVGARPQYSIDSDVNFFWNLRDIFDLGFGGSVITNEGSALDPDSFKAAAKLRWTSAFRRGFALGLNYSILESEFSRRQDLNNLLTHVEAPVILPRASLGPAVWLEPEIVFGIETGARLREIRGGPEDSGAIVRPLAGADFWIYGEEGSSFRRFMVTGSYRVRLPRNPEPYQFRNEAGESALTYGVNPRHYFSLDVETRLLKGLGFTVAYQWGSLPPLFTRVSHQVSLGFSLSATQKGLQ